MSKAKVKQSVTYKKWKRVIRGAALFPVEQHIEELRRLYDTRTSPTLHTIRITGDKLVKASAKDTGARTRAVALMVQAKRNLYGVERANSAMRNYILTERLAPGATIAERNNAVDHIIQKGIDMAGELENFIEIVQDLIGDIDASGWSLRRMIDASQIANRPESVI